MQMPRKSPLAEKLTAQVIQHGRSQLYSWLRSNYDELADARRQTRATWDDLRAIVADAGVKGARGQDPSSEVVRKAWQAVTKDLAAAKSTSAEVTPDKSPSPRRKAAKGKPPPPDDDSGDPPSPHTFTPARIR